MRFPEGRFEIWNLSKKKPIVLSEYFETRVEYSLKLQEFPKEDRLRMYLHNNRYLYSCTTEPLLMGCFWNSVRLNKIKSRNTKRWTINNNYILLDGTTTVLSIDDDNRLITEEYEAGNQNQMWYTVLEGASEEVCYCQCTCSHCSVNPNQRPVSSITEKAMLSVDNDPFIRNIETPESSIDDTDIFIDDHTPFVDSQISTWAIVGSPMQLEEMVVDAEDGAVIIIKNGSYRDFKCVLRSRDPSRRITVRAETRGKVVLYGSTVILGVTPIHLEGVRFSSIRNCTNGDKHDKLMKTIGRSTVTLLGANSFVTGCEFSNIGIKFPLINAYGKTCSIKDCVFRDLRFEGDNVAAIVLASADGNSLVDSCVFGNVSHLMDTEDVALVRYGDTAKTMEPDSINAMRSCRFEDCFIDTVVDDGQINNFIISKTKLP